MSTQQDPLLEQLLALPFDAYAQLMARLLTTLGYQSVQLAGRTDWKGRNHSGGCDLVAALPGGLTPRRVVIQLKQFDTHSRIFQRHLDELCGVALRSQASEAVLITTGYISSSIQTDARASALLPIRIIDGVRLLDYLRQSGIGLTKEGAVDVALFERLRKASTGNSRQGAKTAVMEPNAVVTLQVEVRTSRERRRTRLQCQ